jgi:hypothetical protein
MDFIPSNSEWFKIPILSDIVAAPTIPKAIALPCLILKLEADSKAWPIV